MFVTIINQPGYLPAEDGLAQHDTLAEAYDYLTDEVERSLNETEDDYKAREYEALLNRLYNASSEGDTDFLAYCDGFAFSIEAGEIQ